MSPLGESGRELEEYRREKEGERVNHKHYEESQSEDRCRDLEHSLQQLHPDNNDGNMNGDSRSIDYQSPSFDYVATNQRFSSSPAPVVEKGGDNEFVKVSHLASVQVKSVPVQVQGILKTKNQIQIQSESSTTGRTTKSTRRSDADPSASRSSLRSDRQRNSHQARGIHDDGGDGVDGDYFSDGATTVGDAFDDEDLSVGKFMQTITKSPYEPEGCAERGEPIFREMKRLLLEDIQMNPQIVQMFGASNAECLKKASALIDKSGMLYSQNWTKGTIRGDPVGIIPNHLLLLVLVPNRVVKANELLLSGMCRDLEVYASVNRALDEWGLSQKYRVLRATKKNYKFKTNKRDCFKSAVFVARAHSCFVALGKRELETGMFRKITACLDIMESHLVDSLVPNYSRHTTGAAGITTPVTATTTVDKKRKMPTPDAVFSTSPSISASVSSQPSVPGKKSKTAYNLNQSYESVVKRKRGRPPKNVKHQLIQRQQGSFSNAATIEASPPLQQPGFQKKEGNIDEESTISSVSSRHNRRPQSSEARPSLHELMSRFEAQYNEMGQRYAEMGTLLAQMKTALKDKRQRTEQEIRRELLDEIQSSILESLPKK